MVVACLLVLPGNLPAQVAPAEAPPAEVPPAGPPAAEMPPAEPEAPIQPDVDDGLPPRREHDRARDAVREGQALPLGNIIRELQRTCPGTFLNAVLEERDGRLVYRLQMLSTSGRRVFTIVDAATGGVVSGGCR